MPKALPVRYWPLKPRQREVALLSALLYSPAAIAEKTGYKLQTVHMLLRRSDVRDLVRQHQAERAAVMQGQLVQDLMEDAPLNLAHIKKIRSQGDSDKVQLTAAMWLGDRQIPKTTKHEEEKHIHIHLTQEEASFGRQVLDEAMTIDGYKIED